MLVNFDAYKRSVLFELNAKRLDKSPKKDRGVMCLQEEEDDEDEKRDEAYGSSVGGLLTLTIHIFSILYLYL